MKSTQKIPKNFKGLFIALILIAALPLSAQNTTEQQNPEQQNSYTGPIIDMHLHSYSSDDFWGPAPNPATGVSSPASVEEHVEQTLEIMQQYNVVLGAISGASENSAVKYHSSAPDKFFRGVELREPSEFMDEDTFRSSIQNEELDMLGEVGGQYFGYSPSEQEYYPYYRIAEEAGIPVGIHTGASFPATPYRCCPKFRLSLGNPQFLS